MTNNKYRDIREVFDFATCTEAEAAGNYHELRGYIAEAIKNKHDLRNEWHRTALMEMCRITYKEKT